MFRLVSDGIPVSSSGWSVSEISASDLNWSGLTLARPARCLCPGAASGGSNISILCKGGGPRRGRARVRQSGAGAHWGPRRRSLLPLRLRPQGTRLRRHSHGVQARHRVDPRRPNRSGTTNDDGFIGLTLPPYNGDVLLVATDGTYAEEALRPDVDGNPCRLAVDLGISLDVQTSRPVSRRSPASCPSPIARSISERFYTRQSEDGHESLANARIHLNVHFGGPVPLPLRCSTLGASCGEPRRAHSHEVPRIGCPARSGDIGNER